MTESARQSAPSRCWWLPSISVALWLVFFLALSLSPWRLAMISGDGDPCLHWAVGDWMLKHHAVIRVDPFSHTRPEAEVISKEWLSEVVVAAAGNLHGWQGIVLVSAAVIATTLWLLHRQLLVEGNEMLVSTVLVLLAAMACSIHWLARPHLITHLLVVVFGWQLRAYDKGRITIVRLVAWLVPLTFLWANLHGAFFTGLMLVGIYFAGNCMAFVAGDAGQRAILRKRIPALALLGVICLLATFINPNGWRLHAIVISYLRNPALVGSVNEFLSPNFHTGTVRGFEWQLLLVTLLLLVARPRLSATDGLLIGLWGYFSLHSMRNMPIFGLVVTPILAEHLNAFLQRAPGTPPSALLQRYRKVSDNVTSLDQGADGRVWIGLAATALLLVSAKPRGMGGKPVLSADLMTDQFPVAAVRFVHEHPELVRGEMFNVDYWGGYLMLAIPEKKVFMDSRHEFYGVAFIREYKQTVSVIPHWADALDKYHVGWTVLPTNHPLNQELALDPGWHRIFSDGVATIFSRNEERGS